MNIKKARNVQRRFPLTTLMIFVVISITIYGLMTTDSVNKTDTTNLTESNPKFTFDLNSLVGQHIEIDVINNGDPILIEIFFDDYIKIENSKSLILSSTFNKTMNYKFDAASNGNVELEISTTGSSMIQVKLQIFGISDLFLDILYIQMFVTVIFGLIELTLLKMISDKPSDVKNEKNEENVGSSKIKSKKIEDPNLLQYYQYIVSNYKIFPIFPIIIFYFIFLFEQRQIHNRVEVFYTSSSALEYSFSADIWDQSRYLTFLLFLFATFTIPIILYHDFRYMGKESNYYSKIYPINQLKWNFTKIAASSLYIFIVPVLLNTYSLYLFRKRNPSLFNFSAYLFTLIFVFVGLIIFLLIIFSISESLESPFFFFAVSPLIIWTLIIDDRGYNNQFLAIVGGLKYADDLSDADNYRDPFQLIILRFIILLITILSSIFIKQYKIQKFFQKV